MIHSGDNSKQYGIVSMYHVTIKVAQARLPTCHDHTTEVLRFVTLGQLSAFLLLLFLVFIVVVVLLLFLFLCSSYFSSPNFVPTLPWVSYGKKVEDEKAKSLNSR